MTPDVTLVMGSHWGTLVARFVLGFPFTLAGMSKVRARSEFEKVIANYNLLPPGGARLISIVLPWMELLIGALLLLGVFTPVATVIVAGLLVAFVGIAVMNAARGKEAGCGCFGPCWHSKAGWLTVAARNVVLLALAGYLLIPYLTLSLATPATSLTSMTIGGLVLAVAVFLGLLMSVGAEEDKEQVQGVEVDIDNSRRQFLRYATEVMGGAVTGIFLGSPSRSLAQSSNGYCWDEYMWGDCQYYQPNCPPCGQDKLQYKRQCCYLGGNTYCDDWQVVGGACCC